MNNDYLEKVEQFHQTFNHPVLEDPQIPERDRCTLRIDLIAEELNELTVAIQNKDMVGVADALADLQYVLSGAVLEFGLKERFDEIFNEVHLSNMSKACSTETELALTVGKYILEDVETKWEKKENGYRIVKRASDDKILKSVNYRPANIAPILKRRLDFEVGDWVSFSSHTLYSRVESIDLDNDKIFIKDSKDKSFDMDISLKKHKVVSVVRKKELNMLKHRVNIYGDEKEYAIYGVVGYETVLIKKEDELTEISLDDLARVRKI